MDFFMSSPTVHAMMMQGTAMYAKITDAKELSTKLRGVFNFPLGYYHIVVYADSGITRLQDVKGKRVFLGPPACPSHRSEEHTSELQSLMRISYAVFCLKKKKKRKHKTITNITDTMLDK